MKFWENRPVFVTGATGFLGVWLTEKLLELHDDIIIIDIIVQGLEPVIAFFL